jgi:hypothetical protein
VNKNMKGSIIAVAALLLPLGTPASWADGRGYGHYKHGYGHGHGHRHYYGGHGGYRYYGGHHHHNHHNGGGDDEVAYLVGGLLLGGILTHAYHTSQPRYVAPAPAYAPAYTVPAADRRLVRDSAGNCYESYYDASGREVRVPVAPNQCAW